MQEIPSQFHVLSRNNIVTFFRISRVEGPSPMVPVAPEGSMPPAQLLDACDMDAETMLRLTREGWLEISPAATPG